MAQPCPHCNGRRVRVVNPGRMDGRNIMECTNSNCLATISLLSRSFLCINSIFSLKSATKKRFTPEIGYDAEGSVVVRCPGQREPVKLL
uniref:LITAF domain-containing protein n=1 Tax=Angiostrongylus cantonensis TaxID=6313 RepID=A0A0K0DF26_ANGCA